MRKKSARRKYERVDQPKREGIIARKRRVQVKDLESRLDQLKVEQRLITSIKRLAEKVDNVDYQGWVRMAILFDSLFLEIEPNDVKRMKRLRKIFKLRPTFEDIKWVNLMHREQKLWKSRSRAAGIKGGLLSKTV